MNWIRNLSIKNKLSAIILLSSILLISLISTGLIANEIVNLRRNLDTDLLTLADIMGSNASVGLVFGNVQAAEDTLASLKAKPNVIHARIFDEEGNSFAYYDRASGRQTDDAHDAHHNYTHLNEFYFAHDKSLKTAKMPAEYEDRTIFSTDHAYAFKRIVIKNDFIGSVYIEADLTEIEQRLYRYTRIIVLIAVSSLILTLILARYLQRIITEPVLHLMDTMDQVAAENNYQLRAEKHSNDEIGRLMQGFNKMLGAVEEREQQIQSLNARLQEENQRMSAELEVTRRLQKMLLPKECELKQIEDLDIACFMQPADEVGGDYYDVLYHNGQLKIGIGDVTGHGLESGVVMLMVQMAVRTLLTSKVIDPNIFLNILNEAIFNNIKRMDSDKNLTLSLLDYQDGKVRVSGQHEEIIKASASGEVERIDTVDLGFMVGLTKDISAFIGEVTFDLAPGEGIVLYTDGITEASNSAGEMYGLDRLCQSVSSHWPLASSKKIQTAILDDFRDFVGKEKLLDDVTLVVLRRKIGQSKVK